MRGFRDTRAYITNKGEIPMVRHVDLMPWLGRVRLRFVATTLIASIALFIAETLYNGFSSTWMFVDAAKTLGGLLPWIEGACALTIGGSIVGLASTWVFPDWWIERWARSQENFVG